MKLLITFTTGLVTAFTLAHAKDKTQWNTTLIQTKDCQVIGHIDYYNDLCASFKNGDAIRIQGTLDQSNLVVTAKNRNHDILFMPLGVENAKHSVSGPIEILSKNSLRHSIIYKLDYKTYDGIAGYQIITLRLGHGLNKNSKTCTMSVFDSKTFANIPENERESHMRNQAKQTAQKANFKKRDCMEYEHKHFDSQEFSEPKSETLEPISR